MAATVPADNFAAAVQKLLDDYGNGVIENTGQLVKKIGQKGAKEVKRASWGNKYPKGWTSKFEQTRMYDEATIYNKTPGLPHLLEHGHAKRNGGRVPGRVHIAPVEEQLVREFEKAMEAIAKK